MTMPLRQLSLTDEPGLFEDPVPAPRIVARAERATVQKPPVQKVAKTETAHRTISEVAQEFGVPQHVLRFWETRFTQLKPLKRGGGRRYYRTEDVALIRTIHSLLYGQGYTIRGAQKMLKDKSLSRTVEIAPTAELRKPAPKVIDESRVILTNLLAELKSLRALV